MEAKGKPAIKELLENNTFSISAYLKLLNSVLNSFEARIVGEVSEMKFGPSGHLYFSLKDKKDRSVLSCVIWSYDYKICGVQMREGLEIIAKGIPDVYPPTGRLSFKAKTIQLVGEGELKKEYEKLKKKLEDEGLFSLERKREIPSFVRNVGIITSRNGAVISDFLNNLGRFGFNIKFVDSRVEGIEAVKDLLASVKTMEKLDLDVLVIMRGGGSLESFLAFNNEALIREAANLPFPVIAALGHDKDVPLLALSADKMVSTPTAAANLLNQSWLEAEMELKRRTSDIFSSFSYVLNDSKNKADKFFVKIEGRLQKLIDAYKMLEYKIRTVVPKMMENAFGKVRERLDNIEKTVSHNNPERNLRLGYCIAVRGEKIIKSVKDIKPEEEVDLKVFDGIISTQVKKIKKYEGKKS
ncbi:MAG: exodeoxyribonuclease VII large subunit [Candidatus Pacebacteria bacterium]|nr:exodeoxyribonuclease VII large subunit [Candidatus Paceibacterota bacterium]